MKTLFLMSAALIGVSVQGANLNEIAQKLDALQTAGLWSQVDQARTVSKNRSAATVALPQAPAVVEVTGNGDNFQVYFRTIVPVQPNAVVALRLTQSDGSSVSNGWRVGCNECGIAVAEMWNGKFSDIFQPGTITFEAIMTSSGGAVSYVSATVNVHFCCALGGPLERADVNQDGSAVIVTGRFSGDTYVVLNGSPMQFSLPVRGNTGEVYRTGSISTQNLGGGQMILTVCSEGACSSRVIYIVRSSGKG